MSEERVTILNDCLCDNWANERQVSHTINNIPVITCGCGISRQHGLTAEHIARFYREDYHNGVYEHTYAHDLDVARSRLSRYKIRKDARILDVGCGNGAFVDHCRASGIDAYGVEPGGPDWTKNILEEPLEECYFPSSYFDVVTFHDVLEHMIDPKSALKEVARILRNDGIFIVDFPNFQYEHHWKLVEHLWMMDEEHLISLITKFGFEIDRVYAPVESKITLIFKRVVDEKVVRVLVPPGIGDIYWSLLKIESMAKKLGWGIPDIRIASMNNKKDRSFDYVQRVPFVKAGGYLYLEKNDPEWNPIWKEAYLHDGRTIFEDVQGCNYFIAYNGVTRFGKDIDDCDTEYATNWEFPLYASPYERQYQKEFVDAHGEYFVGYFIPHGMYKEWLREFPLARIYETMLKINKETGKRFVLIGAKWDQTRFNRDLMQLDKKNGILIDMIGKTSLEECFAVIKGSQGVLGFPSGVSILATYWRKPTVLVWNKYFDQRFWWFSCPPYSRYKNYMAVDSAIADPEFLRMVFAKVRNYAN